MEVATARHAVNTAALARDRVALVGTVAWLPVTMAFAYERHRARAYANALEASGDAALAELNLGALSLPPSAAVLAADAAALQLLLGDPARAIATLSAAARSDLSFDDFGRDVLLAAIREAPSEWRRAAGTAVLARHPRAAAVAAGAAVGSLGRSDVRGYRVGLATAGLATAIVALLALPAVLVDGVAPDRGVTAPSFAAPPSVVVVPERALRPPGPSSGADRTPPTSEPLATLVSATEQPGRFALQNRQPARPGVARPAPVAPAPVPPAVPAPTPAPAPTPTIQPQPQPTALAVASPTPAPATLDRKPKPKAGKGKAKGHAKQEARAAVSEPAAPATATEPAATSEPPGHEKHDDKAAKDKQK